MSAPLIVIVEDAPDRATDTAELVRSSGAVSAVAWNAAQTLDAFVRARPALVVLQHEATDASDRAQIVAAAAEHGVAVFVVFETILDAQELAALADLRPAPVVVPRSGLRAALQTWGRAEAAPV